MNVQDLIDLLEALPPTAVCVVRFQSEEDTDILRATYAHGEVYLDVDHECPDGEDLDDEDADDE